MFLAKNIMRSIDVLEVVRVEMNNPASLISKGPRRCYIYSQKDDIIGWRDVEDPARDAEQEGLGGCIGRIPGQFSRWAFEAEPGEILEGNRGYLDRKITTNSSTQQALISAL